MHHVKLTRMFSNAHMMLLLMALLAKPMFNVEKPLFISEQTMDVTWQNIPWLLQNILTCHGLFSDVANYFAMSLNNIHVEK
jgi:hypothetical protein